MGYRDLKLSNEAGEALRLILQTLVKKLISRAVEIHLARKPEIFLLTPAGKFIDAQDLEGAATCLDLGQVVEKQERKP